ncbi:hypothetical protein BT96DRAFT_1024527 [Gymnopus androsaceus JB14]|uniref:MARVEL domain-containing protein n=1 Tax=Gymnopus androsaceus JB14 TaxID=1447944 RepID=A0A6A4GZF9_9AGAR|nr:hypothetical protein BT96DRAFT_1024527 [Gymnopus androsaceus JB14]
MCECTSTALCFSSCKVSLNCDSSMVQSVIYAVSSATIPNISNSLTSTISLIAAIFGAFYLSVLLWVLNFSRMHPRALKREYSRRLQKYAPFAYAFLVTNSLVEASCTFWLLIQYVHQQGLSSLSSKTGLQLIILSSCWTMFTAGMLTILFIHPAWSTHPLASVGSQTVWVFLTLCFWVVGITFLARALPPRFFSGSCASLAYCGQFRALFALSLLEVIILTGAMITMLWIVRQSIHEALQRVSRQLVVSMVSAR